MFIHEEIPLFHHILVAKRIEEKNKFNYLPLLLYIGQGLFKIRSEEMIHYVKEAKEKAFKTVERFIKKKINCLKFEPFKLAKGSFIIVN